jgi:peptidyl-prolyl cis-trans isomerase C
MAMKRNARLRPRQSLYARVMAATLFGALPMFAIGVTAATTALPGDDQVIASRGGVSVTFAEVDARVMELPRNIRGTYMTDPDRLDQVVNSLLLEKQLAAKSRELGADKDPYLELQLEQARNRFLAARAQRIVEETMVMPNFEALAEEKFLANPEIYTGPVVLELTHILVTDRGRTDADAKARAEEARRLAIEEKRDFDALVTEYMDPKPDGSRSSGKLNKVVRGVMVPEFDKAAFGLATPGQISDVVKTRYGYHVIRLDQRTEPKPQPFEMVKSKIVEELRADYLAQQKNTLVAELRSMKIDAIPERVAALRTRYTADGPRLAPDVAANPSK